MDYDITKHGDFKKYYDTIMKRNIWVLGYFGGGSINVSDAYEVSKLYSSSVGVPLESIQICEIIKSSRFNCFKVIFSITNEQEKESDAEEMVDVFKWLTD